MPVILHDDAPKRVHKYVLFRTRKTICHTCYCSLKLTRRPSRILPCLTVGTIVVDGVAASVYAGPPGGETAAHRLAAKYRLDSQSALPLTRTLPSSSPAAPRTMLAARMGAQAHSMPARPPASAPVLASNATTSPVIAGVTIDGIHWDTSAPMAHGTAAQRSLEL